MGICSQVVSFPENVKCKYHYVLLSGMSNSSPMAPLSKISLAMI